MPANTYNNPIIPGFNPDPSIIRHGLNYYLITSSFEYFPGIPIYYSTDLINWTLINHVLTRRSQLDIRTPEPGGGIWAPTIREHSGEFYVTVASYDRYRPQADDRVWPRGFYVKTNDLWKRDGFSDPVYFDIVGFDQDLFWDNDGKVYLSSTYRKFPRTPVTPQLKDFAIHICTIDLATGCSTSNPVKIRESDSGIAEGSHILKRGIYYYLFTAEGGTQEGHCEWVCRSKNGPFGPWELGPHNPLWRNGSDDEVQNTGHADFVTDPQGRWWAVFLGVRPVRVGSGWKTSVFGRESFLVPVTWENDWPVINGGQKVTLQGEGPGLFLKEHNGSWRDDFQKSEMQLGWYRKNTPFKNTDTSLTAHPGNLTIFGGPYDLSSPASPTAWFYKQTDRIGTWATSLNFSSSNSHAEAGTVVYWNYFTYSSIGIRGSKNTQGKQVIRFRPTVGNFKDIEVSSRASLKLLIKCEETKYAFGYQDLDANGAQGDAQWVGDVTTDNMTESPPMGMVFTGMMFGLYAFGGLGPSLEPAIFKYAEFQK